MSELVPSPSVSLIQSSEVPSLLAQIRPAWQAKSLIDRVKRLISIDPSSDCQRLFNAAVHDLREKITIAGIDIAREAARQYKLPAVERPEDIENYPTAKLVDLAHRIGLLSRAEWRQVSRCYEIRRDLEHEDDEYEASIQDCIYIFKTCIEAILSRDPIHLLRVNDVKELIEQPAPVFPSNDLIEDFKHAPQPRQEEILRFLVGIAMDDRKADLVRQNAFSFLKHFEPYTQNPVRLSLATHLQERIARSGPGRLAIRVAYVAGALPYIKQAMLKDFFEQVAKRMEEVGFHWKAYPQHGELLRSFKEVGGLLHCPSDVRTRILKWLILTYLGEPGGRTSFGNIRHVWYSDTAAPLIEEIIQGGGAAISADLRRLEEHPEVANCIMNPYISRRFQSLLDLLPDPSAS